MPNPDVVPLARLVKQMRARQRAYFRTRDPITLDESKNLERAVDEMVESILQGPNRFGPESETK